MVERIILMKNSSDAIGNQTRDLTACSAVRQPTVPPRAPPEFMCIIKTNLLKIFRETTHIIQKPYARPFWFY